MSAVEGRRPVLEALRSGRTVQEVLVASELRPAPVLDQIREAAHARSVPVRTVPRTEITRRATSGNPQGVIAIVAPFAYVTVDEILSRAASRGEPALVVALDGVTDPHNVGALARSAEAVGSHGLLLPDRRGPDVTPAVEKAAAGALAHIGVARVGNVPRALDGLRGRGLWIVALEARGEVEIWELALADQPLCLVVGSEGRGVSRLVSERADVRARIAMAGRVASLNASVAGAVALFAIRRLRDAVALSTGD